MPRKTNKTAHVLNLLASGAGEDPAPQEEKQVLAPNIEILENLTSPADPLADLIKNSLDKEMSHQLEDATSKAEDRANESHIPVNQALSVNEVTDKPIFSEMAEPVAVPEDKPVPVVNEPMPESLSVKPELSTPLPESDGETIPTEQEVPESDISTAPVPESTSSVTASTEELITPTPAPAMPAQEPVTVAPVPVASVPETVAPVKEAPVQETAVSPPVQQPDTPATSVQETVAPAPQPVPEVEPDYKYINLMDMLLEKRLDEFMDRFDTCKCPRCRLDVKALALSNLPPKYIVIPPASLAPLSSFYTNKFNIIIVTELTKACLAIINNPRH